MLPSGALERVPLAVPCRLRTSSASNSRPTSSVSRIYYCIYQSVRCQRKCYHLEKLSWVSFGHIFLSCAWVLAIEEELSPKDGEGSISLRILPPFSPQPLCMFRHLRRPGATYVWAVEQHALLSSLVFLSFLQYFCVSCRVISVFLPRRIM